MTHRSQLVSLYDRPLVIWTVKHLRIIRKRNRPLQHL